MSTTRCQNCNGWGTVCGKCGRARRDRRRNDVGYPCCAYARLVKCPSHTETTHRCDTCDAAMFTPGVSPEPLGENEKLRVCLPCREDWNRYKEVAFDQWQTLRRAPPTG